MVIRTKRGIWQFAVITTLVSLVLSEALNVLIFPHDILATTMKGTAIIVVLVTIPITLWVGGKIRENALLSAELQRLVDRDRLTDVATRDYFFGRMAERPDVAGVSLMVDIDRFKAINDTHGHFAGDAVIKTVASVLRDMVRSEDIVCRFGGEEFVIFLFDYRAADGAAAAEQIRKRIADTIIGIEDADLSVTVSIGGSLKQHAEDINRAIQEADEALYRAKMLGRNRTVFSDSKDSSAA